LILSFLDCESLSSTLASFTTATNLPPDLIREQAPSLWDVHPEPEARHLEKLILGKTGNPIRFEGCFGFHFTRVPDGWPFKKYGLQPSFDAMSLFWPLPKRLGLDLVSEKEWQEFRSDLLSSPNHHPDIFRAKQEPDGAGPFGFVIRAEAFSQKGELWTHFPCGPESVADICLHFERYFGHDIFKSYQEASEPCIVKFRCHECDRQTLLGALDYLIEQSTIDSSSSQVGAYIDRKGRSVPNSDIAKVEFFPSSLVRNRHLR
jgi:hypothetical protein